MGKSLIFIFLLSFSTKTFSQNQVLGFSLPEGKKKLIIPFQNYSNLMVIPVKINGQLSLHFILDTGVRNAILTEKIYADIMGLSFSRQYLFTGPGGEKLISALVANNISLSIPPTLTGYGHSVLVLEKDYLQLGQTIGYDVQGILGYEIFSRFVVKINYEKQQIILLDPKHFRKPRSYEVLPMTIEDTKPYINIPVKLQGKNEKKLKLMVDTGASHCLLLDPTTDTALVAPSRNIYGSIGKALGGLIMGKVGRLDYIKTGKSQLKTPIASFPDPGSYTDSLRSTDVFRHGTLGGEALSRYHVIFDYSGGRLYLKKNTTIRHRFNHNLSGLTLIAKGYRLNTFEVSEVRKGSAGEEAGLRAGDQLTKINQVSTATNKLPEINQLFNSRPGRKISLEIIRDGVVMQKKIVLKDEL